MFTETWAVCTSSSWSFSSSGRAQNAATGTPSVSATMKLGLLEECVDSANKLKGGPLSERLLYSHILDNEPPTHIVRTEKCFNWPLQRHQAENPAPLRTERTLTHTRLIIGVLLMGRGGLF